MKTTVSATVLAKPISWVTQIIVMPACGQLDHDVEHLLDHLRIKRRGRLVEQHDLRLHAQRAGDGDALLLAAGELARDTCAPARGCGPAPGTPSRSAIACFFGTRFTQVGARVRLSSTVRCGNRLNCWNTMPTSRRMRSTVRTSRVSSMPSTTMRALLVLLQRVDAADHRRLAGAGRAADDDALAAVDGQRDVAQHVEGAVPLVDAVEADGDPVDGW